MKLSRIAFTSILFTLAAAQAMAFSEDDKSMNSSNGTAKFSDPDENTPSAVNLTGGSTTGGTVDPSSIRYDYDATSGSYVPHKQ